MKATYITAIAVVLAGLAATANVSPARAGDKDVDLVCVEVGEDDINCMPVDEFKLTCGETGKDTNEECKDNANVLDLQPPPGTGRQAHVPLTAKPSQAQPAVPPRRNTSFYPKVKIELTGIDSAALPKPTARKRVAAKKMPQLGLAQPVAAMSNFSAPSGQSRTGGHRHIR